ncbi:MAG: PTS system mannose/fructose/sorbose family transporter subunit IID [Myxococcales bacterium]|jgi:PTS system mannose-specific IID component|nr:PTS system mannose/fructose/sorbose family transporter subunit IID [Myxococcales bacterium]
MSQRPTPQPAKESTPHLPRLLLLRVFVRTFWLQVAWNPTGMQNLGMVHALWPALEALYPDPAERRQAVERHVTAFNTHPYLAAAIIGGVLHHEARIARGQEPPERATAFKAFLMGPLAALGDGFFWCSLRPAFGALAVLLTFAIGLWSVPVALLAYNAIHLWVRARLFLAGLREGDAVLDEIARWRFSERRLPLRCLSAACLGASGMLLCLCAPKIGARLSGITASSAAAFTRLDWSAVWPWLLGALILQVTVVFLERRHLNPYVLLLGAALLAFGAGALG